MGCSRKLSLLPLAGGVVLLVALFLPAACKGDGKMAGKKPQAQGAGLVREPAMAGSWYPGTEKELRAMVEGFLAKVPEPTDKTAPVALIVPHAGLIFSGQVAAHSYKQLAAAPPDVVVLVGPSHRAYFSGCAVWPSGTWKTPLGPVEVDSSLAQALISQGGGIQALPEVHAQEHSLELQLPFVQTVAPKARILPVMMGDQAAGTSKGLGMALASVLKGYKGRYVLVASSDLSHFHPYERARQLDSVVAGHIERADADGLAADLDIRCEACGGGPIVAVTTAARLLGAGKARILSQANSGDVTGDKSRVVGYIAAAIYPGEPDAKTLKAAAKPEEPRGGLNAAERAELKELARRSIEAALKGESPKLKVGSARLNEPRGAFVTLKLRGNLRGCIGNIVGRGPLAETVVQMARAAALDDPRFPPLTKDEFALCTLEISVLTPLARVSDPGEVVIGRDGLLIRRGSYQGLLLPQVATEQGWDRDTFLDQTCVKAGLPPGSWRAPDAQLYRFGAEVF